MRKGLLSFCLLLLFSAQARAQTWEATFIQDVAADAVTGSDLKIMVTGAGEQSFEARTAAKALSTVVRQRPEVSLVMTGEALGDLMDVADDEIVKKSTNYGVNFVYIVRVFEGSAPGLFSVVVTVYSIGGKVVTTVNGEKGVAIGSTPPAAPPQDGWGEQPAANDGWGNPQAGGAPPPQQANGGWGGPPTGPTASASAAAQYASRYVRFDDWNDEAGSKKKWNAPYKGAGEERLKGSKFYTYIRRDDLAKKYKRRSALVWSIFGLGGGVFIGGMGFIIAGAAKDTNPAPEVKLCYDHYGDQGKTPHQDYLNNCVYTEELNAYHAKKNRKAYFIVGAVASVVGIGVAVSSLFIKRQPVTAEEARNMANWFNSDLKKELGLPPDYTPPETARLKPRPKPKADVYLTFGGESSTGVMVDLSF